MKIKWLKKALNNAQEIYSHIALDNPIAAKKVLKEIETVVNLLSDNPSLGKAGRIVGTRELIKAQYIIPYRVKNNQIEILRVFDATQKPPVSW